VPAPPVVPPPTGEGRAAEDAAATARLAAAVGARIGDDPCRTTCPKRGDPIRCPFHHAFALDFWDAAGLERWALRHCPIARALRGGPAGS